METLRERLRHLPPDMPVRSPDDMALYMVIMAMGADGEVPALIITDEVPE